MSKRRCEELSIVHFLRPYLSEYKAIIDCISFQSAATLEHTSREHRTPKSEHKHSRYTTNFNCYNSSKLTLKQAKIYEMALHLNSPIQPRLKAGSTIITMEIPES